MQDEIINEIRQLDTQILALKKEKDKGIITDVGVTYLNELTKKELKLKEQRVLSIHTNTIQTGTIVKNGKEKAYYQTRVKGLKNPPRSYSYEGLIEKLFNHYFGSFYLSDYSFKAIFDAAIDEKIRTEAPKEKTILDYQNSYKAFITDDLGAKDIRFITKSDLMEYMQKIIHTQNLTKKRFYKFKGVLNIVYNYATNSEHEIVSQNVVPKDNVIFIKNCQDVNARPEDKAFQPHEIEKIRNYLWGRVNTLKYDLNGYAILFSSHTGVRQGEIPSLQWEDISESMIHIHSQQNDRMTPKGKEYYYNPTTKNEKGESRNGRYIPLTKEVKFILSELKRKQKSLGINSKWVFAKEDGDWTTTIAYYESLYRICVVKLGLSLSNNHAFRIALNSYVFIPMGLNPAERARILGHSVKTNLENYTFSRDKEYVSEIGSMWDSFNESNGLSKSNLRGSTGVNHF